VWWRRLRKSPISKGVGSELSDQAGHYHTPGRSSQKWASLLSDPTQQFLSLNGEGNCEIRLVDSLKSQHTVKWQALKNTIRLNTMPEIGSIFCSHYDPQAIGFAHSQGGPGVWPSHLSLQPACSTARISLKDHIRPCPSPQPSLVAVSYPDTMAGCPKTP
jgi:hypothetical protein